jgi:hypothetical protein
MSFYIWCEIVCLGCAIATAGRHTTKTLPRREMKADAKASGWVFYDDGNARCPGCAKDHAKLNSEGTQ